LKNSNYEEASRVRRKIWPDKGTASRRMTDYPAVSFLGCVPSPILNLLMFTDYLTGINCREEILNVDREQHEFSF